MRQPLRRAQRGITLVVGLIMVVLITLIVLNAFNLSSSNLKSVGNMQVRDEAVAAANHAVERLISSFSTASLATQTFTVDLNKDGVDDYTVSISEAPKCVRKQAVSTCAANDCNIDPTSDCAQSYQGTSAGSSGATSTCGTSIVDFDIKAVVSDASVTGARVTVREGVRIPVSTTIANSWCS
jgi:Tfp pilus assembly protein PilX